MLVTYIFSFSCNVSTHSKTTFQFFSSIDFVLELQMLSNWTKLKFCPPVKDQLFTNGTSFRIVQADSICKCKNKFSSMGECNTVLSAYTLYRHLE